MEKKAYIEPRDNMAHTRIRTSILAGSTMDGGKNGRPNMAESRSRAVPKSSTSDEGDKSLDRYFN